MKFDGHCFWCGTHGHMRDDCRKKAAGKPRTARSPTVSSPKGKAKSSEGRKRASSFDVQKDKTSCEKFDEEAVGDLHRCRQPTREVQPTRLASLGKDPGTGTVSLEILQERRIWCQFGRRLDG